MTQQNMLLIPRSIINLLIVGLIIQSPTIATASGASNELISALSQPVYADPQNITYFFTQQFQHSAYPRVILSASLDHVAQLISYAPLAHDPLEYAQSILHMFNQRLRTVAWIDPITLLLFLQNTSGVIQSLTLLADGGELENKIASFLHDRVYQFLHEHLDSASPYTYHPSNTRAHLDTPYIRALHALDQSSLQWAQELQELMQQASQNQKVHMVRFAWKTFLDTALSRLVWSPASGLDSWRSTCALASQIIEQWYLHILPDTAATNDLLWALLSRYGYFYELMYNELSPELTEGLSAYLHASEPTWLDFTEIDPLMLSKREYLKNMVFELTVHQELERASGRVQAPVDIGA